MVVAYRAIRPDRRRRNRQRAIRLGQQRSGRQRDRPIPLSIGLRRECLRANGYRYGGICVQPRAGTADGDLASGLVFADIIVTGNNTDRHAPLQGIDVNRWTTGPRLPGKISNGHANASGPLRQFLQISGAYLHAPVAVGIHLRDVTMIAYRDLHRAARRRIFRGAGKGLVSFHLGGVQCIITGQRRDGDGRQQRFNIKTAVYRGGIARRIGQGCHNIVSPLWECGKIGWR